MRLKLSKPLIVLDTETTGVKTETDKIITLSVIKIATDYTQTKRKFIFNPGMPIPPASTEVHGITDEVVAGCKLFSYYAKVLFESFKGCDIAAYNAKFDVAILYYEFFRCELFWDYSEVNIIDPMMIFKIKEPHTLAKAYERYTGNELKGAHDSDADTQAALMVLSEQLDFYQDLPDDPKELALFCNRGSKMIDFDGKFAYDKEGDIVFTFGTHVGKIAKRQPAFLEWMMSDKATFSANTKAHAKKILNYERVY